MNTQAPMPISQVATALLGEPNKSLSTPKEMRFGSNGSLSVDLEKNVFHNFETGEGGGVSDLIRLHHGDDVAGWLEANGCPKSARQPQAETRYRYDDENGNHLFSVVRKANKKFLQQAADGAWTTKHVRKVLFRLPSIARAPQGSTVYLVEGEKDVLTLERHGLLATTSPGGAGKWRDDFAASLVGKKVIVLPDNDDAGRGHADDVSRSLKKCSVEHSVIYLTGLPEKGDVSDWLAKGNTIDDLKALRPSKPNRASKLTTFSAASLQNMDFPAIRWIVPDLLPEGLTILAGAPKLGKSWMVLDIGCAVAEGGEALGKDCDKGGVLYLALEDNQRRLKSRLRKVMGDDHWPDALTMSTTCPRLDQGGIEAIEEWIDQEDDPRLVVIDTLAMVKPPASARGSAYDSDVNALKGLHDLASERRIAIVVVTHLRKAEADDPVERINSTMGQSGVADTLVVLMRNPGGGSIFYARGRDMEEVELSANLVDCRWTVGGDPQEAGMSITRKLIFEAVRDGAETPKDVFDALGEDVGQETIRKQLRRMVNAGHLINPSRGKYATPVTDAGVGVSQPSQPSQREG